MKLANKVASGSFWTTTASLTKALTHILRLAILTRFLEKSDFGLIAIVTIIIEFTQIFTDLGVSVALFSRDDLTKRQKSSLYWVGLSIAIFLYFIVIGIVPFIAAFYEMEELKKLIPLAALDLIIISTSKQFRIYKQKDLEFKQIALIDITALLTSLIFELILVYNGVGVYSLVLSALFTSSLSSFLILATTLKEHPLSFHIDIKENKVIYKVGIYQTGAQILDFLSSQLDVLIIGKLMSGSELGVYNLTKQLIVRLYSLIVSIFTAVTIPILSKFRSNEKDFKTGYLKSIQYLNLANCAIYGCLVLLSKHVLNILYGSGYDQYSSLLMLLCIWATFSSVASLASSIVVIYGRTDIGFRWTIVRVIFNTSFVLVGAHYSIWGIVIAQVIFAIVFFLVYWKIVVNRIANFITIKDYALPILKNIGQSGLVILVLLFLAHSFFPNNLFAALFSTLSWLIIYFLVNKSLFLNISVLFYQKNNFP